MKIKIEIRKKKEKKQNSSLYLFSLSAHVAPNFVIEINYLRPLNQKLINSPITFFDLLYEILV